MNDIATQAASDDRSIDKKIATREANFSVDTTIYALAQCIPHMSSKDCLNCLENAVKVLNKCCDVYRGARVQFPSCFMRHEVYPFYNNNNNNKPPHDGNPKKEVLIICIVVAIVILLFLLSIGVFHLLPRRRRMKRNNKTLKEMNVDLSEILTDESLQYDFSTIEAAANFFSMENKIGVGGFGDVYKGELGNGQEIAVKRLSRRSSQGVEEFKNEVVLVAKLQHRNLIVIYNISNFNVSRDMIKIRRNKQRWIGQDDKIIRGIVRGLVYLHEDSRPRIIHRDLKASNILLDKDMNPKISDFGMARIFGVDQIEGSTNIIVGTYGYMSPEYAMHGQFSVKSDVFSFGVLLLEIISGKGRNNKEDKFDDLLVHAWKLWKDGRAMELVDPSLIGDSNSMSKIMRCIHIGLLCVQIDLDGRPTTTLISHILSTDSTILSEPNQPASFKDYSRLGNIDQLKSNFILSSSFEELITEIYPR
ncbi:hypothetical protein R3W88_031177 [Solanum pinnatisectum]|uniref:Uncharacterized protein n=1 Tax=Solanum pinnatisectum TaxID=50273 RepID=A0AAV9LP92_9SOLN|nr:hypothetical protein R3W88_031177 [Solanum pinnatisectum]